MSKNNYDFIILGGGGTGLAAAMYSARLNLKTLVLGFSHGTELPVGGVITTTIIVENYPGFIKLTGQELAKKLADHAKSYDLVTIKEEKVVDIKKIDGGFSVKTEKNVYEGKTILFATGTKWRKLSEEVKGSKEFVYNRKEKIKRAFFIIFSAYATLVAAMIPLWFAGAGLLRGFAVTTIIGITAGVFITRPAYASVIERLLRD